MFPLPQDYNYGLPQDYNYDLPQDYNYDYDSVCSFHGELQWSKQG